MLLEKDYSELAFTVQIGDFLRIHATKCLAEYLPHFMCSAFGLKSVHIIVYKRAQEHMVSTRDDCVYVNLTKFEGAMPMSKETKKFVSQVINEYLSEYERRYKEILWIT